MQISEISAYAVVSSTVQECTFAKGLVPSLLFIQIYGDAEQ